MAALDKRDGQIVWTTEPLGEDHTSHSSPLLFHHRGRRVIANCSSAHGFGVDADSRLYCFDERGKVGLLNPTADRLEVTGQFQLITDRVRDTWAHPVVHDGRLYLRYHDSL